MSEENRESNLLVNDNLSLRHFSLVLKAHRKLAISFPVSVTILAAIIVWNIPELYRSQARILPPNQSNSGSASAVLGQLGGGLASAAAGIAGIKNPSELYVGILKSRTIADGIISKFQLQKVYDLEYLSDTRLLLEKRSNISAGKEGIITIEVVDRNPQRAAELADAYIDGLRTVTKSLAVTEASRRRLFFETQFNEAKASLEKAEIAARTGMQTGGLAMVEEEGRSLMEVNARIRAQISTKEVERNALSQFAANGNPQLLALDQTLAALRQQLAKSEGEGNKVVKSGRVDGKGLQNVSLLRELEYQQKLYELLGKQYEAAKIDEARDASIVQVLDSAVVPDKKFWPRRLLTTGSSLLASLIIVALFAMAKITISKKQRA